MSRRKEFNLGPESARELYGYRRPSQTRSISIGRQISEGTYTRADVEKMREQDIGAQPLPMKLPPMAKPHEQSEAEFERDPRTWWHGEYRPPAAGDTGPQDIRAGGFHVGTQRAAQERLDMVGPGRNAPVERGSAVYERAEGRLFAGRIHGTVAQRLSPDPGDVWTTSRSTRLYENLSEHKGSISANVPGRPQFKTHQESIQEHLASQENPREALEGLRPRVRAEYEARGGRPGSSLGTGQNLGQQFSSEEYRHPKLVEEESTAGPQQQTMLHDVTSGGKVIRHLTAPEMENFERKLSSGPIKMKVGKTKAAF